MPEEVLEQVFNMDEELEHGQQMFSCSICFKAFLLKSILSSHKSREHRGEVRCIACDKTFSRPADLRRHMASHRAPPAGRKPMADLSSYSQGRRRRDIAAKFSAEVEGLSQSDRRFPLLSNFGIKCSMPF